MRLAGRLWQLGNVITFAVVLLSARIIYWALVRAGDLRPVAVSLAAAETYLKALRGDSLDAETVRLVLSGESAFSQVPQPAIQRTIDLLKTITRGAILDRNGRPLAFDQESVGGIRVRAYTEPSLAHVLGYVSGIRAGITGLELTYNDPLLGLDRLDTQFSAKIHTPIQGSELILTIDSRLQRAAEAALAGRAGAAVVLDGTTGAILAMASQPGFDPNQILNPAYLDNLVAACGDAPACQGALVNRAAEGLYTPGSVFKTVTLIAALDTGQVSPDTLFDFGAPLSGPDGLYYVYEVGGGVIPDPNHDEAQLSLEMAYAKSANAAFARMGDEMPPEVLIDYAGRFGFSVPAGPTDIPMATPQLADELQALYENDLLRASTAIGQGELLAHPLAMARVVLAVINHGDLPQPFLVETILGPGGAVLDTQPGRDVVRDLMKPETADLVRRMMITTAEQGSGRAALVEGLTVGGKTGTAQVGGGLPPHAWFIGFAEVGERSVVIAVVVENAGEGSAVAAPIFATLADTALRRLGEAVDEVVDTTTTGDTSPPPSDVRVPLPDIPREPGKLDIVGGPGTCPGGSSGPIGSGAFVWPVEAKFRTVVGDDFIARHPGVDLGAGTGAPVHAADAGVVVFSNWSDLGYGNAVVIDHGNGYQTLYGHLSQVGTYCGAAVAAGEAIGLAGATGNAFGPHLHFEIRVADGFLNPWNNLPPP